MIEVLWHGRGGQGAFTAAKLLGAGREHKEDAIDPAVGIVMRKSIGDPVRAGEALCTLHANPASDVAGATELIARAFAIGDAPVEAPALVHYVVEQA